jgi:hypothetical protein
MEALREIHEVNSGSITIQLPKTFPYQQVEVIVLPVMGKPRPTTLPEPEAVWQRIDAIREQLASSGRTFSDSTELVREDRGW